MVILLMVGSGNAWGECTLISGGSGSVSAKYANTSVYDTQTFTNDDGDALTISYTCTIGTTAGNWIITNYGSNVKVEGYYNNDWHEITTLSYGQSNQNQPRSHTLSGDAKKLTRVRFYTTSKTAGHYNYSISNFKVVREGSMSVSSSSEDMSSVKIDSTATRTFTISAYNLSGTPSASFVSGADAAFSASTVTYKNNDCPKQWEVTVYYKPTCANTSTYTQKTCTLRVSLDGKTKDINIKATPTRRSQSVSWELGNATSLVAGDTLIIGGYASSSSTIGDKPAIRYTSLNTGVIRVSGDTLFAVNGMAGHSAVITAHQDADCKYAYAYATQTFQVTDKAVPTFTLYINNVAQATKTANLKVGDVVEIHCTNAPHLQLAGEDNTIFEYSVNGDKSVVTVTAKGEHANAKLTVSETGNTRIAALSEDFTFNISKHTTNLSSLLDVDNFYVGNSAYAATAYDFANGTAYNTNNNEVTVDFSSTDPNVINIVNGQIKALKAGTATITISQTANNKWTGASVQQTITVKKRPAVFTWNVEDSYNWNKTISNPFSSNNNVTAITCSSNNRNVADYVNGKVVVYNVDGMATFTLHQDGNDVWEETSKEYTVTVSKAGNHVTFTHGSNLSASKGNYTGVIEFLGVPSQVSSNLSDDASAEAYFYVWEAPSASGQFTRINNSHTNGSSLTESLKPGTRAIKFQFDGDGWMRSDRTGTFSSITVTERREVSAVAADVDCGTANNGSDATTGTAYLNWYNVKPLTCSLGGDHPEAFELVTASIASKLDDYAENVPITIRGRHDIAPGTYTAVLNVTNGTESTSFNLTTTTTRQTPVINWKANLSPLSVGDVVTDAASAGSATVKYTVDGTYLTLNEDGAVVAENATDANGVDLIAYVEQDNTWEAASETIKVVVTNLQKQTITWNDKLSFKFTGNKVIDLTATSSSGLGITYELSGTGSYATLDNVNKKLTVTGIGNTLYLTAKTVDHAEYYPAENTKTINSRDPNASCGVYAICDDAAKKTLHTIDWADYTWDSSEGEPGKITFYIRRGTAAAGDMALEEYYDNEWHRVNTYSVSTDYAKKTETLNRKTTKVSIGAPVGATLKHYVKDVVIEQAKYCELSKSKLDFGTVTMGTAPEMSFTVHYSNLAKSLDIELENAGTQFTVDKAYIGDDCGEHGTVTVTVTYNAANYVASESTNLVISNTEYTKKVSLTATVQKASQTITWDPTLSLKTTDVVAFDAVTTDAAAATGVIVKYAVTEGSDVATVTEDGHLTIIKNGTVKVKAYAEGNSQYEDATDVVKTFTISKVTPTITKNPTINAITLPATLNDVAIDADDATAEDDKHNAVTGSFAWQTSTTKVLSGANDYVIVFTPNQPTGKDWYNEVVYNISVTGNKGDQSITWTRDNVTSQPCSTPTTFDASSNRGLDITYVSDNEAIAHVEKVDDEYRLVVTTSGTVHITAKQLGNGDYLAAENVTKTITLTREQPVITTPPTADEIFTDNHLSDAGLNGGEGQVNGVHAEGIFAWKNGDIQPEYGVHSYTATFTPSPAAWYYPAECQVSVTVNKHPHSLSWDYAGGTIYVDKNDLYFGGATSSVELDNIYYTTSSAAVAEVDAEQGNKLIIHGKGTIEVIARSEGNTNYYAAEQRRTLTILPLTTTVTANPAAAEDLTYGQALNATDIVGGTVKGSDDAVLEGTWAWNNGAEELNAGQGQVRGVAFTPNDSHWYATATSTATVNVNKANPEVTPQASAITYGQPISASSLTTKTGNVDGSWSWAVDATQVLNAGVHNLTANFTSNNANYNNLSNVAVTLTVNKANPSVTPQASAITYGQPISASSLTTKTGNVDGSWSWAVDATQVLSVGNHDLKANFSSNDANYNNLSNVDVTLIVNKIETLNVDVPLSFCPGSSETFHGITYTEAGSDVIEATGATRDTVYNVTVTVLQPTVGADSKTITVGAEETWNAINLSGYAVGEHSVVAVLTNAAGCDSTVTLTLTVNPLINEFTNATGDGDWNNNANWSSGAKPTEDAPNVIIQETLTVDENITVGDLTIEKGATVLIVTGGTLTVTGETEHREEGYGDIHVKDDGNLVFENTADFKVNDFILDAKLGDGTTAREGASGQVENPGKMEIKGDAYFELALDPSGECSQGWYTFTVPFQVNALTGISRYHEGNLISITYNRNYALMVYDEAARATGGKGWNYFKGTLQPGICYTITIDDVDNVYRFKKTNDGAFNTAMTQSLHYTEGDGNGNLRGWNGLGNGTLQHINLGEVTGVDYVQIYDHGQNRYIPSALNEFTYVVGSAFFVQSPEAKPDMTYVAATTEENGILRVAKRYDATKDLCLTLTKDGDEYLSDRMYVGASEDAQDSYEIGHDLAKMGTPTEAKVAQIWANAYGLKLCDVEMPLVNNSANCEINLYAPQAGSYTLDVERAPENTMLYLTYNGRAIWNLTYSPYVFDLTKGTTEGYGLKMYVMQVATDLENGELLNGENGVRKVLIDDVIYIVTPEGKMYDITGKSANY